MFTQGLHEAFAGLHRQEPARIQAVLQPVTNGIGMAAAPEDQHRAQLGQMPAQTLMLPVRHAAQFAHLAQHHHERPLLGAFRRGVKHAGHGKRVGVVRIVHDVPAAPAAAGKRCGGSCASAKPAAISSALRPSMWAAAATAMQFSVP